MRNLFDELRQRSVWQVFGLYLAGSWMVLQVIDVIGSNFGLPEWVAPAGLALLIVGLPIVLLTAFLQHGLHGTAVPPSDGPAPPDAAGDVGSVSGVDTAGATVDTSPTVEPETAAPPPRRTGTVPRRLFTWRKALLGGGAAFLLLALVTAGWIAMRVAGIGPAGTLIARGALENRAMVVLADFGAEDPALSDAATEALRVDLSQSRVIRLADPALVQEALERMGRDPAAELTPDVAAELAVREGAGAIVTGEVIRAGAGYVLSAQVISTDAGTVLTSQRETADGDADIIPAIDRLSQKLRERLGDTYKSMAADPPLERVTTTSLEALKLYSRAADEDTDRITILEQAVALDSSFAMAWRGLGILYSNRRTERARMVDALTRAFEHRDHLTEVERRKTASMYYTTVDFEPRLAYAEYQGLLELLPDDPGTITNLGVLASSVGDHEEAAEYALRAVELLDDPGDGMWNVVTSLVNAGRVEEAAKWADSAEVVWGRPNPRVQVMPLAAMGRLDEAEAGFRQWLSPDMPAGNRAWLALRLAQLAAARGRAEEADRETRISTSFMGTVGNDDEYFRAVVQAAWTDLVVRDDAPRAIRRVEEARESHPIEDMEPRDRPYLELAEVYARAGRPDAARALLAGMRDHFEETDFKRLRPDLRRVRGEVELAEGRPEVAIESFRLAFETECHICALPGLALAYEAAGQPDSAIAAHTRYVETPYSDRFLPYAYPLGQALAPTHERLAQLLDRAGRLDEAVSHYARFVELWENADPALHPRVQAARERLEAILQRRG